MRIANPWRCVLMLAVCIAVPSWAAQSLPDASSLQQGAPSESPARLPVPGRPAPAEAIIDAPSEVGPTVTVRRLSLIHI